MPMSPVLGLTYVISHLKAVLKRGTSVYLKRTEVYRDVPGMVSMAGLPERHAPGRVGAVEGGIEARVGSVALAACRRASAQPFWVRRQDQRFGVQRLAAPAGRWRARHAPGPCP